MKRTGLFLLCLACLQACADSGGKLGGAQQGRYVDSQDLKEIAAEKVTPISGAEVMGVRDSLVGSRTEIEASLSTIATLKGTMPIPVAQRYVEGIRDKLLVQWHGTRNFAAPPIKIIGTRVYDAEAVSVDAIEVSAGVLMRAKSEDEVAFVIGHELGHMLLSHQARRQQQLETTENAADVLAVVGMVGVMYATGKHVGTTVVASEGGTLAAAGGAMAGQTAVAETITALVDPGWSSRQEEQADLVGIDLMTAANYNPVAATDALERVKDDEEAAEQRLAELEGQKTSVEQTKSIDLANLLDDAWSGVKNKLNRLRANHPKPDDRIQSLTLYRANIYATETDRPVTTAPLLRLQSQPEMKAAVRAIQSIRAADDALGKNLPAEAMQNARASWTDAPYWWAPYYLAALARLDMGDTFGATNLLSTATRLNGAPYEAFERYVLVLITQHNYAMALNVLNAAATRFGGPDLTWPDRIIVLRYSNNLGAAQSTLQECLKSSNPRLRDSCSRANTRVLENSTDAQRQALSLPGAPKFSLLPGRN
jgi:Zn-dependent protease with chaperone function